MDTQLVIQVIDTLRGRRFLFEADGGSQELTAVKLRCPDDVLCETLVVQRAGSTIARCTLRPHAGAGISVGFYGLRDVGLPDWMVEVTAEHFQAGDILTVKPTNLRKGRVANGLFDMIYWMKLTLPVPDDDLDPYMWVGKPEASRKR